MSEHDQPEAAVPDHPEGDAPAPLLTLPGTEPIEIGDAESPAVAPAEPKPTWAARRAARKAEKAALATSAAETGVPVPGRKLNLPWDVRLKIAVVLSFLILVTALILNRGKGAAALTTALPPAAGGASSNGGPNKMPGGSPKPDRATAGTDPARSVKGDPEPSPSPAPVEVADATQPASTSPAPSIEVPSPPERLTRGTVSDDAPPPVSAEVPPPVTTAAAPADAPAAPGEGKGSEEVPPLPSGPPLPVTPAEKHPTDDEPFPVGSVGGTAPKPSAPSEASPPEVEPNPPVVNPAPKPPTPEVTAPTPPATPPSVEPADAPAPAPATAPAVAMPPLQAAPSPVEASPPSAMATATPAAPEPSPTAGGGYPIPNLRSRPAASTARPDSAAIPASGPAPSLARGAEPDDSTVHVVRRGENFWTISRYYYGSGRFYKALWAANRDQAQAGPEDLYVGTAIRIPPVEELDRTQIIVADAPKPTPVSAPSIPEADAPTRREPEVARVAAASDVGMKLPVSDSSAPKATKRDPRVARRSLEPATRTYVVQSGNETLRSIARDHLGDATRGAEIRDLNQEILDANEGRLKAGMSLKIPDEAARR